MIGFLKTRGPVCIENTIDKTLCINKALINKNIVVTDYNDCQKIYFGIYLDFPNQKQYDYYFNTSKDFSHIDFIHIFDYGLGIEEELVEISENLKQIIIGKCLLFKK